MIRCAVVADLAAIFNDDMSGKLAQAKNLGPLITSSGAENAVAAAGRQGVKVELVLPSRLSQGNRRNAGGTGEGGA